MARPQSSSQWSWLGISGGPGFALKRIAAKFLLPSRARGQELSLSEAQFLPLGASQLHSSPFLGLNLKAQLSP